ncbi:molybdenum cofactor guanylyltransferase [Nesterenkonia ebinurensis]|uniref:molybdenum cofactor guanylyltransferase n=1 Tax=Nesterenkonia ebinurensis TaxID=2608252 RepID=UPI00123C8698|nr:NTP transferase domain-containing protein [Nesterenkonia ebinurensis]
MQAVLLAGGAGTRLGGADKALLVRHGRTLLEHWTAALAQRQVGGVVVGGEHLRRHLPEGFLLTRETPPLSGPAAAVCAGVRALPDPSAGVSVPEAAEQQDALLLLAVDTVDPGPLLDWLAGWLSLLSAAEEQAVVPRDRAGRFQMLGSAVSGSWLRRRVSELAPGEESGQSLRWLLGRARSVHPVLPDGLGRDVDLPEDAGELGVDL